MTNQQMIEGNWNELRGKIKERWGQLTNKELRETEGAYEQVVGLIQQKTGESREAIEKQLAKLNDLDESVARQLDEVRGAVQHYVDQASAAMHESYEQASQKIRASLAEAEQTVQRRPTETVFAAFGAGLIAGALVGLIARSR